LILCIFPFQVKSLPAGLAYSDNGVPHINKIKLLRARLVLGLVITFGGSTIPVFIQATRVHSAWPSLHG